jgi:SWI/SNF chromatin-remodeling complex subunit SWI1
MNAWHSHDNLTNGFQPDATANPNLLDASMFNANGLQFQNAHLQQQQQQQQLQQQRSQTPQFQVNSVVPSKRARDDGIAASPHLSRSQTPQQSGYPGAFQGNQQPGQPLQAPNPYQHLQHGGSANATPSPTMSNQQFRPPPQTAQRMQTVSPNPPFPQQQQQQAAMGMSPPPDANGRVHTPQQAQFNMGGQMGGQMPGQMGGMNYMPGTSMPQAFNQNFGTPQNMAGANAQSPYTAGQVQLTPNLAAQQAEMHRMHQMKVHQQQMMAAQNRAAAAQQAAAMNQGMMMAQQQQQQHQQQQQQQQQQHRNMATPTRPQGQGMNQQAQQNRQIEEQNFLQKVGRWMAQSGRPFEPQPLVCGRPVSLFFLFNIVLKAKGSKRVTAMGQWPQVAAALRYQPPEQFPTAAMEMKEVFERCLGMWEAATWASMSQQQKAKMDAMQQAQMTAMGAGQQMSPTRPMPQTPQQNSQMQNTQYMQQLQQRMGAMQQPQPQMGQMTPVQNNAQLPTANGWSTPQPDVTVPRPQTALDPHRKSVSRQLEGSPAQAKPPVFATPPPSKLPERGDSASKVTNGNIVPPAPWANSTNYQPNLKTLATSWGGIDPDHQVGLGEAISQLRPDVPDVSDMGNLDIHALTMSLQSGLYAEVRLALDYLVKISNEPRLSYHFHLEQCEDLLDVLVDCAEEQIETLAEDSPEVSDILDLNSYEDVIRSVKTEIYGLQDIAEAGTVEYELDRCADRLIAITTILRNFSFPEHNQPFLASPPVVKLVANAIRLVGTRTLFLRSHLNTQDFMKDVVVFLSNVSDKIALPSREDALSILHFLLSFAPGPCPSSIKPLRFPYYSPAVHPYYPPAIDSLAKLLARDEPNRSFYKEIFTENIVTSPSTPVYQQYDLLTRAFAFAIAVIPERVSPRARHNQAESLRLAEARKPSLTQGMLAADILATLCPGVDVGLAKAWLQAEDCWAQSLVRYALLFMRKDVDLTQQRTQQRHPSGARNAVNEDAGFALVTPRALSVIKRLGQKTLDSAHLGSLGKAQTDGAADEEEAGAADETGDGGEVKSADGAYTMGSYADEEWDRALAFSGLNGEIVPRSEILLGALFLIGIDQVVLKEMFELSGLDL